MNNLNHGFNNVQSARQALFITFVAPVLRLQLQQLQLQSHQIRQYRRLGGDNLRLDLGKAELTRPTSKPYNHEILAQTIVLRPHRPMPGAQTTLRSTRTVLRALDFVNGRLSNVQSTPPSSAPSPYPARSYGKSQHSASSKSVFSRHAPPVAAPRDDHVVLVELNAQDLFANRPPICELTTLGELKATKAMAERKLHAVATKKAKDKDLEVKWTTEDHHLGFTIERLLKLLDEGSHVSVNYSATKYKVAVPPERAQEIVDMVKNAVLDEYSDAGIEIKQEGVLSGLMQQHYRVKVDATSRKPDRTIKISVPCSDHALDMELNSLKSFLKKGLRVAIALENVEQEFRKAKVILNKDKILARLRTTGRSSKFAVEIAAQSKADDEHQETMTWTSTRQKKQPVIMEIEEGLKQSVAATRVEWLVDCVISQRQIVLFVPDKVLQTTKSNLELHKMMQWAETIAKYPLVCEHMSDLTERNWSYMIDSLNGVCYQISLVENRSEVKIGSLSKPPIPTVQAERLGITVAATSSTTAAAAITLPKLAGKSSLDYMYAQLHRLDPDPQIYDPPKREKKVAKDISDGQVSAQKQVVPKAVSAKAPLSHLFNRDLDSSELDTLEDEVPLIKAIPKVAIKPKHSLTDKSTKSSAELHDGMEKLKAQLAMLGRRKTK